jgi:hypothetical protein
MTATALTLPVLYALGPSLSRKTGKVFFFSLSPLGGEGRGEGFSMTATALTPPVLYALGPSLSRKIGRGNSRPMS